MSVDRQPHVLAIRLLGTVAAKVNGVNCRITSGRQRSILALLASEAGQVLSTDQLVNAVWGDAPPPSAINALQVHVSGLRSVLGVGGVAIQTRPPGYVLDTTRFDVTVSVDALEFEQMVRAKLASGGGPSWDSIDALWTGEPFGGAFDAVYGGFFVERLVELHRGVVEARCDDQLARGLHDQLVADMEAYVEAEPYRECRWRQWVLALYRCGRQSDALATFQRGRHRLIDDLGIEPGPALSALEHAILAQDPALELAPSWAGSPVPRPSTLTVGRLDEIEHVVHLLAPGGAARIVTLVGPGGVGKTRLAQEVAARLADGYCGRISFCDLSNIIDAELVVPELARCLGVSAIGDPVRAIVVATAVPTLIVVDNAEQVTAAAVHLGHMSQTSECRFLVTSRVPLRLSGEHVVPVRPLEIGFAAELFQRRVDSVSPGLAVGDDTARQVAGAVDGLALAIELAAALSRVMSPNDIVRELSNASAGLDALTAGAADTPSRHRSLTAALAWSVQLLSDPARSLLLCLGPFAAGFSLQDVAWLAPPDLRGHDALVRDLVGELVDSSLVTRHSGAFAMLTTVRAYIRSLIPADQQMVLANRHAEWVGHTVDDLEERLKVATTEAVAISEFVERLPDLRAAYQHLRFCGRTDRALRIIVGTRLCWVQSGSLGEALRLLNDVEVDIVAKRTTVEPAVRVQSVAFRGLLAKVMGDRHTGIPLLEQAATELRQAKSASTDLVNTLCHLAADRAETGDHEVAGGLAREAIAVAEATGSAANIGMTWDLAGYVAGLAGNRELAIAAARHAVEISRHIPMQLPQALSGLAEALAAARQTEEAVAVSRHAVEQAKAFSMAPTMIAEVNRRTSAALATVDPAAAAIQLASAAASYAAVGMEESLAETLSELAAVVEVVDPAVAVRLLGASSGTAVVNTETRASIESRLRERVGRSRFDAERLAGKFLDTDAMARLAVEAANAVTSHHQL